jgi:hypothetical protein
MAVWQVSYFVNRLKMKKMLLHRSREILGYEKSVSFAEQYEPSRVKLVKRVDGTAGPNWQPA